MENDKRVRIAIACVLILALFTFLEVSYIFYTIVKAQMALAELANSINNNFPTLRP